MDNIKRQWDEYQQVRFPDGVHGKSIDGHNLTLLHCDTASCIITAINMDGILSSRSREQLQRCRDNIAAVIPQLDTEPQEFFGGLLKIADSVLTKIKPA